MGVVLNPKAGGLDMGLGLTPMQVGGIRGGV